MRAHARRRIRNLTARAFAVPVGTAPSPAAQTLAGAAPTTVATTVAAVKACARLSGQPSPAGEQTGRMLADIRREGRGAVLYVGEPTMRRIAAWRVAAGLDDGPLFRRIRRGESVGGSALSDRAARSIIKARAADAGIEGRVSGHSLRIGAAQSLTAAGAGLVELQQAGRWDSPSMPAHCGRPACDPGASMPRPRPRWSAPRPAPPCLRSAHTTAQEFERGMDKSG